VTVGAPLRIEAVDPLGADTLALLHEAALDARAPERLVSAAPR
jgi:hypothetical protein